MSGCHQHAIPRCPWKALQKRLMRCLALPHTTYSPPHCVNKHQRALRVENVLPEPTALFNLIPLPLPRFCYHKPQSSLICINLHSFKSLPVWLTAELAKVVLMQAESRSEQLDGKYRGRSFHKYNPETPLLWKSHLPVWVLMQCTTGGSSWNLVEIAFSFQWHHVAVALLFTPLITSMISF